MKRAIFALLFVSLFLVPTTSFSADEVCTETVTYKNWWGKPSPRVIAIRWDWDVDTTDGTLDCTTEKTINGWVMMVEFDVDDSLDAATSVDFDTELGGDILSGSMDDPDHDAANTDSEFFKPYINNQYDAVPYNGKLTFQINGNTDTSSDGVCILYITGNYE